MEEKKTFDKNSIIGFALIGLILIGVMYMNPNEDVVPEQDNTEQVETESWRLLAISKIQ